MNATKYAIEKIVMSCMSNNCLPSGFFYILDLFLNLFYKYILKKLIPLLVAPMSLVPWFNMTVPMPPSFPEEAKSLIWRRMAPMTYM